MPEQRAFAPHCDQQVLHAPGECKYCDDYQDWQELRKLWRIAFTGHRPEGREMSCPSDFNRGLGASAVWPGNTPEGYHG
jgi:hypothetical protein